MTSTFARDCVFEAIVNFKRTHGGMAPTTRELCKLAGYPSPSHMRMILIDLRNDGRIRFYGSGTSRNIQIPGEHWEWSAPNESARRKPDKVTS